MHKTQSAATTAGTMTHRMKQIADKEIISRPYHDNYFNCSLSEPIMDIKCVANNCLGQTSTCETEPTNTKVKIKGDSSKQLSQRKRLKVEGKGLEGSSFDEKDSNVDYGAELLSREEEIDETYILTNPTTTSGQNDPVQKQDHDVNPNESNESEDDGQYAYPHATQGLPTELSRQVGQGFAGFQVHPQEDAAKGRHQSQLSEYRESKHCIPPARPYNDEASKPSCNPYKNSTVYDFQYDANSALKVSEHSSCSVSNKDPLTLTNPGLRVNKEMPLVPRISDVLFERLRPMAHFSPEFNKVEISPFRPMDGVVDSARTAVMRSEMWRLSTFSKLPTLPVSAVRLAQSGFYYDEELDEILCYSCGLKKKQWNKSEKVAIVHLAMSPKCHHANCKDERNIAEAQYPYSPRETECSQNGSSYGANNTVTDGESAVDPSPTLPRNDTAPTLGDRNVLPPTPAPTQIHTPTSANLNQDGRSLALPPPAGRAEQLQRHSQMAAQSAGTARPEGTDSSSLNEASVAVPTTAGPSGKQQIGGHNAEAVHTGKDSALPLQNHFKSSLEMTSVQVYRAELNFQSPPAVPATTLVNYSVQVVQAPDANPFERGSSNPYRHNEGNEDGAGKVPGNGLLDMRRAASPENALVSVRLATFLDWPTRGLPNRRLLVIAGFHYMGTGDSVRCFYCGVTLRNWRENDDPWVTHVRFRFSCDYVKAIKGEDFVYRALLQVALGHAISSETGCITSSESAAVTNGIDNSSTSCSLQQTSPTSIANTASAYAANSNAASDNATAASGTTVPSTAPRSSTTVGMSKEAPRGPRSCSTTEQGSENSASRSDMNAEGNRDQATLRSRDASEGASTSSTENGPDAMGTGKKGKGNNKGGASKAAANTDGASVGTYAQNGVEVLQTDAEPDKHRSTATLPQTSQQTVAVGDQSLTFQSTVSTEYPTVPNAGVAGNHGDATSFQQLQETNHRLRRRVTCRLCGNRPVDTIFLPCGHLCTCETCAATIRMCCLCNDRIRGTAHVYME
ncbi:hypothetical protein V1264_015611 [Littorina saxatilis]|uniref:RING-type domain-containing protein n=3 Tax=Littorina saxatilis TaxID=31220 RepID=A0AAN9GGN4_9CAEN